MKTWKAWPGIDCPDCGSSTEIESDADCKDGDCYDSDQLRCSDPKCQRHTEELGYVAVYDVDDIDEIFEAWPIGDDDKPYRPEKRR